METIQIQTLKEKVQDFREKAREILRMKKINALLQEKFNINKDRNYNTETIKHAEKELARRNYQLNKLDKDDPDYEDKLKTAQFLKKTAETQIEDLKNSNIRKEFHIGEKETKVDEEILKWE